MGHSTRPGTSIIDFSPDDTDKMMYLDASVWRSLSEILDTVKIKWPDIKSLDDVDVSAEHIHTSCVGYDRYDPGDYTDYLVLKIK